jgi:hypothetical protein
VEKKRSVKKIFRQLETSELQSAAGGGRLRVPVGYTDSGEPIYADSDEPTAEYVRIWKPSGLA